MKLMTYNKKKISYILHPGNFIFIFFDLFKWEKIYKRSDTYYLSSFVHLEHGAELRLPHVCVL
jgi:hypothetical protein